MTYSKLLRQMATGIAMISAAGFAAAQTPATPPSPTTQQTVKAPGMRVPSAGPAASSTVSPTVSGTVKPSSGNMPAMSGRASTASPTDADGVKPASQSVKQKREAAERAKAKREKANMQ